MSIITNVLPSVFTRETCCRGGRRARTYKPVTLTGSLRGAQSGYSPAVGCPDVQLPRAGVCCIARETLVHLGLGLGRK